MFHRNVTLFLIALVISVSARAADHAPLKEPAPPAWAYPVDPPDLPKPVDNGTPRHVPGSPITYTLSQVRDGFSAPDWHPHDHPPMPEVVVHGHKPAVMACGYCHRAEGTGGPENASLAGLPVEYILQQIADFRSGARSTSLPDRAPPKNMISSAKAATPAEIAEAAAYFSSLKPKTLIHVVESDRVPKTGIHGWHLIDLKTGETEPIGQRIVEFPADLEQFVSRDTHAQFTAYVPPGSIERGRLLATTGGAGRTVICATCHGPELKGLAPIPATAIAPTTASATPLAAAPASANAPAPTAPIAPALAGRSPSYLVRQLYDFQHHARAGAASPLMQPTVEHLTLDDMIALAAYAASLTP